MSVIDFTSSQWGHVLHSETMGRVYACSVWDRIVDLVLKRRRYSVIVHTSYRFVAGDVIQYLGADNRVKSARVARVEWEQDPRDMATVEFVMLDSFESNLQFI